ncbi:CPBP family intramembrane glutamic endopeptidase [Noviherbaspirillum galbum]|uniref:CPBP family intramembrane metalloprotease n=1 Tax=Noviherbaspirillum galbum TaxID=2709383 RepID=A0A6B3SVT4_9BURK|nr:CPBP family glutamic-type intramembrane protease [Noviherbaspirillum galbum]NEX64638.1 CPBP family intramembrane metalloprotease [Noviherbaspirillum galbum]
MIPAHPAIRFLLTFVPVFLCYQAAEGIGIRMLHSALWQAVFMLATIPLALLLGKVIHGAPLRAFAMEGRPGALAWLSGMFLLAIAGKAIAVMLGAGLGVYSVQAPAASQDAAAVLKAIGTILFITFIPSLAEDILTRGLLLRKGPLRAGAAFVIFSTAVYVLNHVYRLANGPMEWFMLACFGIAYATACARFDSLWPAVGLHWGWNAASGLLGLVAEVETRQPGWAVVMSAGTHLVFALVCIRAARGRVN